jgi:hypothetical protein
VPHPRFSLLALGCPFYFKLSSVLSLSGYLLLYLFLILRFLYLSISDEIPTATSYPWSEERSRKRKLAVKIYSRALIGADTRSKVERLPTFVLMLFRELKYLVKNTTIQC